MYLLKERRQLIGTFPLQNAAPICPSVNQAIAEALQSYLLYAFDRRIYTSEIVQSQKDWHNSLARLYDRNGLKYHFIQGCERAIGLPPLLSPMFRRNVPDLASDPANLRHTSWYAAREQAEHNESFFDLVNQSVELSLRLAMFGFFFRSLNVHGKAVTAVAFLSPQISLAVSHSCPCRK